jgi:DNA modification methylase
MNTGFDLDILEQELRSIEGIDLGFFGFDLDFAVEPELDFDDGEKAQAELTAAAAQQPPRAKLGQLWALGEHRLLVGDCTSAEAVNRLTGGQQMDLCVTDPPYNVDYVGKTADALTIENDSMNLGQFYEFLRDFYKQMLRALKPGGSFYVFYSPGANGLTFREALHAIGGRERQILAWVKNSMVLGHSDYHYKHEPCLYGWKEGAGHYFTKDRTQTTVFENRPDPENMTHAELVQLAHFLLDKLEALPNTIIRENKPARNALHPTMKPIPLLARLIQNSSRRGEKVIDFFGGSGSTLMACQETGRVCYTMELDPKYADVIIARWEESTGGKAVLMYGDQ